MRRQRAGRIATGVLCRAGAWRQGRVAPFFVPSLPCKCHRGWAALVVDRPVDTVAHGHVALGCWPVLVAPELGCALLAKSRERFEHVRRSSGQDLRAVLQFDRSCQ